MDMLAVAQGRGVDVVWDDSLGARHGEYDGERIILNSRRPEEVQRLVLAHELGHAWHRHQRTDEPRVRGRQEREADEHAAVLLVRRHDYQMAERLYGPNVGAVAAELEVPARFVERLRDVERRGGWGPRCMVVA